MISSPIGQDLLYSPPKLIPSLAQRHGSTLTSSPTDFLEPPNSADSFILPQSPPLRNHAIGMNSLAFAFFSRTLVDSLHRPGFQRDVFSPTPLFFCSDRSSRCRRWDLLLPTPQNPVLSFHLSCTGLLRPAFVELSYEFLFTKN